MELSKKPQKMVKACTAATIGLSMALTLGIPAGATELPALVRQADSATPAENLLPGAEALQESDKLSTEMLSASGDVAVYVQFKGQGAYESTQPDRVLNGSAAPVDASAQVQAIAASVTRQSQQVASESSSEVLYTTHNVLRGAALFGDADDLRALAQRSDVEKITPIVEKLPLNSGTNIDTGALAAWANDTGYTGDGVKIAVIDTGVDYTHSTFGGPGTTEAYDRAAASTEMPSADSGLYDPAKYIGGYDLVGDDYNPSSAAHRIPQPDTNPLDCRSAGHGTHVAGTAVGYGVNSDGSTFDGDYADLDAEALKDMKVGPGSAPEAGLIGLRVFGCAGSTTVSGAALDMVLDPNGDGDFSDRANIVNLSLGSDYSAVDDPEADIINGLARQGILSVVAAGNANGNNGVGDTYSILGTPGTTVSALTVANSVGSTTPVDKAEVSAPADIAGPVYGSYSLNFNYLAASDEALSGTVVAAPEENKYGCEAFTEDFDGKWVFLDWADETGAYPCGSTARYNNVQRAGGAGVVLASSVEVEELGIGGNTALPGIRLSASDAAKVRPAAEAGTLEISLNSDWVGSKIVETGNLDTINSSTSRGHHGSLGRIKPDVAAPGTNIGSAGVGMGDGIGIMSGTSMAAPHVAGVAALVMEANQDYNPAAIKAAIMNSAVHDLKTADGNTHPVDRVGAGRVDAAQAVKQRVLTYSTNNPTEVSESFGVAEVVPGSDNLVLTRKFTVDNRSAETHTYSISYAQSADMPGVEISVPGSVTVEPGQEVTFTVTATVEPSKLEKVYDGATEKTQLGVVRQYLAQESGRIVLTENGTDMRVPVQIAPKPVSDMKASESTIDFAGEDVTTIELTGTPVNQGGYRSLVGAFELGASSERIPTSQLSLASAQGSDLQYVGATRVGDVLAFGVSTWGNTATISPSQSVMVNIDLDNDSNPEYILVTGRATGLDYPLARLYLNISGFTFLVHAQPINGTFGTVDTNLFDTNAMVLPVSYELLELTEETAANLRYSVSTYSWYHTEAVDQTDWISYNPLSPNLAFEGQRSPEAPLFFYDEPGEITVARGENADDAQALLLHMHNATGDLTGMNRTEDGGRAEVLSVASTPAEVIDPRFTDVPTDYQFYREIAWLSNRGITTGWPDGTFRPHNDVERAAMAAFFYRMAGSPQYTAPSTSRFSDVPTDHQFYKEISWMADQGITTGWPDGTFRPGQAVNRDAMAAFFYRAAGSPHYVAPASSAFTDVDTSYQFYKEISWLADQKITTGWDDGTFRPVNTIKRDAMAAFIYRYTDTVLNDL